MKKSILATLLAGLVTLGASADSERHMMKLKVMQDDNGPTVIQVQENGTDHEFEFTAEDIADADLVANRLAGLDEKTRNAVMMALKGIHHEAGNLVFIDEESLDLGDGEKKVVVIKDFRVDGGEHDEDHNVMINVETDGDNEVGRRVWQSKDGKGFAFKVGPDGHKMRFHHGAGHSAKVLEKLLQHSELTEEQINKLQALLDSKRK